MLFVVKKQSWQNENAERFQLMEYGFGYTARRENNFFLSVIKVSKSNIPSNIKISFPVSEPVSLFSVHLNNHIFKTLNTFFVLSLMQQPNASQGCLILEVCRSHTMTHHSQQDSSRRVIGSSHRPIRGNTQHSQETYIPATSGIRTRNPSKRSTSDTELVYHLLRVATQATMKYLIFFLPRNNNH
jgi:hypothetical protein